MTDCPGAHPEPEQGDPWCPHCRRTKRRQLAELDDILGRIGIAADGYREQGTELGRPGGDPPSPSPGTDLINEFETALADWEWEYRAAKHLLAAPRRGYLFDATSASIGWMYRHLDGVLAEPRTQDFGHFVTDWHRRLLFASKGGDGRRIGRVACSHCKLRMLFITDADDHWTCGNCGRWMSKADYNEYLAEHATRAAS